ncbi:MAG: RHS repeat-associated core domain-containing protein, partial [Pirellula sp.]
PDGSVIEYRYNGDGHRVEQLLDSVSEKKWIYDGNTMLMETDGSGTVETAYTYKPGGYGRMVSQRQGSDSSFAHFDGVKNLRMLTDDTGMATDEYDFDAFGSELSTSGSTLNAHRWKGESLAYYREPDAAPSLQYALHFRNYDPLTGTFPSRDPAEDDSNLYRYVKNNPLNASDPSGLAELDPKNVPRSFIDKLVENGAEWRHHLRSADDKHSSVSFRYVDPETGDERVAIFRSRDTTSYLIWTETRWELMGTAPLKGMSYDQAFNTIHDSPIEAMAANDAVAFMQAIPLVRTADSISQGKVSESVLNLASDVTDTLSLGGTAAGSNALKWAGRSILAGQVGLGTYEATQQGDTSRLKGAMVDLAVQSITGTKSTKSSTSGKLSSSGNEVAIGEASAQGLAPSSGPRLVHMSEAADAINSSKTLGLPSDLYAGPASNASRSGWSLTRATGLDPGGAYKPVFIPQAAESAFSKPLPIGPVTAWQRFYGQEYAGRGTIDLLTGQFTRTGINRTQAGWYVTDSLITGGTLTAGGLYWWSTTTNDR